jgi:hypothetical protein
MTDQILIQEQLHQMFIESEDCIRFVNDWIKEIQVTEVPTEIFKEIV